jgi:hypothetical protein
VLDAMRSRIRPSLRSLLGPSIPEEIDALVLRALSIDPGERFVDVVQMMREMRLSLYEEGELLSREVSDVTTPGAASPAGPSPGVTSMLPSAGVTSILPSVEPGADVTGARLALLIEEGNRARTRRIFLALAIVLGLGVAWELWLSTQAVHEAPSPPADAEP